MPFFRMRLILALVVGITLVSVGSTYFEVLAHKISLRRELERRSAWLGTSLQPEMEQAVASGDAYTVHAAVTRVHGMYQALGFAVYGPDGRLMASAGPAQVFAALSPETVDKTIRRGAEVSAFGHDGDWQWLEDAFPLKSSGQLDGVLVVLEDARFIRTEGNAVWRRSSWQIVAFVLLIVGVTLLMVRWFLMRPMVRVAIEMSAGRSEGRLALSHLVDMDGMLAWRQVFEIQLDLHTGFAAAQHRRAHAVSLGILQFDGNGLICGIYGSGHQASRRGDHHNSRSHVRSSPSRIFARFSHARQKQFPFLCC